MNLKEIENVLIESAYSQINLSYCIWGKHGIGKTSIIESIAKKLGYKFRNIRLSQIDSTELLGFPTKRTAIIKNENGEEESIEYLDYAPPKWFIDALKGNYIIFLDELNRAKKDNIQAAFELIQEKSLNGRKLPSTTHIWVACNPASAKYDTIEFDEALIDRFCHIQAKSDFSIFNEWGKSKNKKGEQQIDQDILNFLSNDKTGQLFDFTDKDDDEFPVECKPSPRSWEKLSSVYRLNLDSRIKARLYSGIVGNEVANLFVQSLATGKKPITLEEIIAMNWKDKNDPVVKKIKKYSGFNESGELVLNDGEEIVEMALLNYSCEDIIRDENKEFVEKNAHKILEFLSLIPSDLALKTIKKLVSGGASKKKFWTEVLSVKKTNSKTNEPTEEFLYSELLAGLEAIKSARESINPLGNLGK